MDQRLADIGIGMAGQRRESGLDRIDAFATNGEAEPVDDTLDRADLGLDRGTIAIIGSVAGDRGRKANYTYGASKGLLGRYAEGMQHRFAGSGVKIVLIKPGPTDTPMTTARKAQGRRLAPVAQVARETVNGIRRGRPMVYTPPIWWPIMLIARHIPRFMFNRLSI